MMPQDAVTQFMHITCLPERQCWTLREASNRITLIALCAAHRVVARGTSRKQTGSRRWGETLRFFTQMEFKEVLRCAALRVRFAGTAKIPDDRRDEELVEWCRSTSQCILAALSVRAPGVNFSKSLDAPQIETLLRRGCKLPDLT